MHLFVYNFNNSSFLLSLVYASNIDPRRNALWNQLANLDIDGLPWMLVGDFNCILNRWDKQGDRGFDDNISVQAFNSMIFAWLHWLAFHVV